MPFVKGQKAINPGGLSPRKVAMQRRLEGLTIKAVDVLEKILSDDEATNNERLAAAREVFDRAVGKPKQQATLEVRHDASPHLTALVAIAAGVANRASGDDYIDVTPIELGQLIGSSGDADVDGEESVKALTLSDN